MVILFAAISVLDSLHPSFVMDEERLRASYADGRDAAKKGAKQEKLFRDYTVDIGKTRSARGWSFTAPCATLVTPSFWAKINGFFDQREYNDEKQFTANLADALKDGPQDRNIKFLVFLAAWPGVNDYNKSINRSANPNDVRDVKFVLIVDGKTILKPIVVTKEGERNMTGEVAIPETHTATGSSNTTASGSAIGSNGTYATGTYSAKTSSTVTYSTTRIEAFDAYFANYTLRFPLFDSDGRPYITPATKELTIKVVRANGEHSGTFRLDKYR